MPSRSWMAAWALAATLANVAHAGQDDAVEPTAENKVNLVLQISGLGPDGGKIEVRPGHKGCQFEPIVRTIEKGKLPPDSVIKFDLSVRARSTTADRDCSFAITVKEPDRPSKTYHRGLRLAQSEAGKPVPEKVLKCYLSSPSIAARGEDGPKRR